MTAISGAMPADLAEAVRSLPCGACLVLRGEYCSCEGTHLVRWELAAASALVSRQDYRTAADAACPAPPGSPPGLAVVPELSGVVCTAAGHPLRWAAVQPPLWLHLDPVAVPSCAGAAAPRPAPGEPCRYHRRHWLLAIPAVEVAGRVPACRRCARKHARRARRR
ncbi:MAG: hypothetical protein QOG05_1660 [Streptosporangiaceae bacterium]|jgi:hypothetical protein|nr:hypothetical protein [Streptosporangiaceae bacterium]